LLIKY